METRIESGSRVGYAREGDLGRVERVHKVKIAKGAIYVTYDPLKITEKKIEESIRTSGNSVTSAAADTEPPSAAIATRLANN